MVATCSAQSDAAILRRTCMKLLRSRIAYLVYAAAALSLISLASNFYARPRPWAVAEVPIAFWSWRNQSPDQADVIDAIKKARATKLFVRAGQIDYHDGRASRIRALSGSFPRDIELHLVYNATRTLLDEFEKVDPQSLAACVASAYKEDLGRVAHDGANVRGLQLDLDVPTRLLPRYERTLVALRNALAQNTQLSITGLPTWMESRDLDRLLNEVDFWVPQFYGAEIPERKQQLIPTSSPRSISHFVKKARQLDRPFYAGLSAYSVAILYNTFGELVNLRGDIDPAAIASDPNLELMDRQNFENEPTGEWRYVFLAKADGVTDGLAMRAGDFLVVQMPSAASLRTAANIVREEAGEQLLGICVFRLPAWNDRATLTANQVQAALNDQNSFAQIDARLVRTDKSNNYRLELKNTGTAGALLGTVKVDLTVPAGSLEKTNISVATLCADAKETQPCSPRRANLIRLTPNALAPNQTSRMFFALNRDSPETISVAITMLTDAGGTYSIQREVKVEEVK